MKQCFTRYLCEMSNPMDYPVKIYVIPRDSRIRFVGTTNMHYVHTNHTIKSDYVINLKYNVCKIKTKHLS